MEISLKNLLLAGIGSMAYTYEKAEDIVNELVKKGEIAVNDGKELSEELKRKIDKYKSEDIPLTIERLKTALFGLNLATKKDIDELKKRIDELEKK
jgi:polyhydroxyalkanoate synthesis regulator phasin